MNKDISRCYELLELEEGASVEQVRMAYRDLVKVWHPDRFQGDQRLLARAQEKLKAINLAYERLLATLAQSPKDSAPSVASGRENTTPTTGQTTSSQATTAQASFPAILSARTYECLIDAISHETVNIGEAVKVIESVYGIRVWRPEVMVVRLSTCVQTWTPEGTSLGQGARVIDYIPAYVAFEDYNHYEKWNRVASDRTREFALAAAKYGPGMMSLLTWLLAPPSLGAISEFIRMRDEFPGRFVEATVDVVDIQGLGRRNIVRNYARSERRRR